MHDELNRLIQELVHSRRWPTSDELLSIQRFVAQAPFSTRGITLDIELVGREYLGCRLGNRACSGFAHLAKRVLVDEQWAEGTTLEDYVTDLHSIVQQPEAEVAFYMYRGTPRVAILGRNTLAPKRCGARAEVQILVVYDADYGTIVTGYQTSGKSSLDLPEGTVWLNRR